MPEFDQEKRISLFKCALPKKNIKGPDLRATFTYDGVDYRASFWLAMKKTTDPATGQESWVQNKDKNGNNWYSGTVELDQQAQQQAPPPQPSYDEPPSTDIPF